MHERLRGRYPPRGSSAIADSGGFVRMLWCLPEYTLPSSALMSAIPAKVAGVKRIAPVRLRAGGRRGFTLPS